MIFDTRSPAAVFAIDAAAAQIEHAGRKPVARRANFQVGDARALPFPDATFDVDASALVINFIADRARALSEMRRVTRTHGAVAGYVWDFGEELSPSGPFRVGMREVVADLPALPGSEDSSLGALRSFGATVVAAVAINFAVRSMDIRAPRASIWGDARGRRPRIAARRRRALALGRSKPRNDRSVRQRGRSATAQGCAAVGDCRHTLRRM